MQDEDLLPPTTIRVTASQKAAIALLQKEMGHRKEAPVTRHLIGLGLKWLAGERPERASEAGIPLTPDVHGIPLAAAGVGAGTGQLELIPGEERPYFFRRDFLERKGWTESDPKRFTVYRLGPEATAWSMHPTIDPESVMLVDTGADRDHVRPRDIWIVRHGDGLVVKRVTVLDDHLVLESDNRDPEYAPMMIRATRKERRTLLVGLVVWFATDLEPAPKGEKP